MLGNTSARRDKVLHHGRQGVPGILQLVQLRLARCRLRASGAGVESVVPGPRSVGRAENAEGLSLPSRNDGEAREACCSLDIETQKGKRW